MDSRYAAIRILVILCAGLLLLGGNCGDPFSAPPYSLRWSSLDFDTTDDDWCYGITPRNLYRGDFDGDGRIDLFCQNSSTGRMRIDYASHGGTFRGSDWIRNDTHWCVGSGDALHVGDFDGDGLADLLCHNSEAGRREVDFQEDGFRGVDWSSADARESDDSWCYGRTPRHLLIGDFDGDGKDDLFCHNSSSGRMRIDHANASGTFYGTNWKRNRTRWCVASGDALHVGDFDGDGRDDLLCHNSQTGSREVDFEVEGFQGVDWSSADATESDDAWCYGRTPRHLLIGDFDRDGQDDLFCHNSATGRMRIDHANPSGTFYGTDWSRDDTQWCVEEGEELRAGDFNGDGRADLLCHGFDDGVRRLRFASSSGDFELPPICDAGSTIGDGALSEVDLHFVILVDPTVSARIPTAMTSINHWDPGRAGVQVVGDQYFDAEVELINEAFVAEDGNAVCEGDDCVSFRLHDFTFFDQALEAIQEPREEGSTCGEFLNVIYPPSEDWTDRKGGDLSDKLERLVDGCDDPRLVHPGAVNFYVYDKCVWDATTGAPDCGGSASRGRNNMSGAPGRAARPYVFVDYNRMFRDRGTASEQPRHRAGEEHELGHAHGLGHVKDTSIASDTSDSNIMQSEAKIWIGGVETDVPNGLRNEGFSNSEPDAPDPQETTIVVNAREHEHRWYCD